LRWNNIHSRGATVIFEALQKNESIKILDISFNPIGTIISQTFLLFNSDKQGMKPVEE